jgi:GNAT superfamily N-acetyltransferase
VNSSSLSYRAALPNDAAAIADLVNSGYRGAESRAGWTTEADYLVGKRTDPDEISALIADSHTLLLLCLQGPEIVGSMQLQRSGQSAYLGMFVVKPSLQGQGIGRQFMQAAEDTAARVWSVKRIRMTVITLRHELLAYYERRGYRRTGELKPFPIEDLRSTPTVPELQFEVLEKDL